MLVTEKFHFLETRAVEIIAVAKKIKQDQRLLSEWARILANTATSVNMSQFVRTARDATQDWTNPIAAIGVLVSASELAACLRRLTCRSVNGTAPPGSGQVGTKSSPN